MFSPPIPIEQVVITDLVHHEWSQNIVTIEQKARDFLTKIDSIVKYPHQAADLAGTGLTESPSLSATTLVADLVALSTNLLNQAIRLDPEDPLIRRTLDRVMTKRRPSHAGHVKDSINFEHYLEFARHLHRRVHGGSHLREQEQERLRGTGHFSDPPRSAPLRSKTPPSGSHTSRLSRCSVRRHLIADEDNSAVLERFQAA